MDEKGGTLSAYLGGIETMAKGQRPVYPLSLSAYLGGIETRLTMATKKMRPRYQRT